MELNCNSECIAARVLMVTASESGAVAACVEVYVCDPRLSSLELA